MATVLQLSKPLAAPPTVHATLGITVRNFAGPEDIEPWLALRERAFARERVGVRKWTVADFAVEFLDRWWWQPQRMWLAELNAEGSRTLAGGVTLAMRGTQEAAIPVVHWLVVDPAYRRRGVGRALMSHLEQAAWNAGFRQIHLETHAAWQKAVSFYESLGYRT